MIRKIDILLNSSQLKDESRFYSIWFSQGLIPYKILIIPSLNKSDNNSLVNKIIKISWRTTPTLSFTFSRKNPFSRTPPPNSSAKGGTNLETNQEIPKISDINLTIKISRNKNSINKLLHRKDYSTNNLKNNCQDTKNNSIKNSTHPKTTSDTKPTLTSTQKKEPTDSMNLKSKNSIKTMKNKWWVSQDQGIKMSFLVRPTMSGLA